MEFGCVCPRRVQDGALELKNAKASTEVVVGSPISSNKYEDVGSCVSNDLTAYA